MIVLVITQWLLTLQRSWHHQRDFTRQLEKWLGVIMAKIGNKWTKLSSRDIMVDRECIGKQRWHQNIFSRQRRAPRTTHCWRLIIRFPNFSQTLKSYLRMLKPGKSTYSEWVELCISKTLSTTSSEYVHRSRKLLNKWNSHDNWQ